MEITLESRPDEGPSNGRSRRRNRSRVNILKDVHGSATLPRSNATAEAVPPPCYTLLKHMAPLLILVQLKYQAKGENNIFEQNLVVVCSFIIATSVYALVLELTKQKAAETKSRPIRQMLRRAAVASGVVSAVSLVSMFLPHRISLFVPLITWFVLPVVLSWPLIQRAYNWLRIQGIITAIINKICTFMDWARGREPSDDDEASSSSPV